MVQRLRDSLALEGLTPLDRLLEEALANYQQVQAGMVLIGGVHIKKPRADATPAEEAKQRLQHYGPQQ
jgi:hypothetical protein